MSNVSLSLNLMNSAISNTLQMPGSKVKLDAMVIRFVRPGTRIGKNKTFELKDDKMSLDILPVPPQM